jgi:hypothetical protein
MSNPTMLLVDADTFAAEIAGFYARLASELLPFLAPRIRAGFAIEYDAAAEDAIHGCVQDVVESWMSALCWAAREVGTVPQTYDTMLPVFEPARERFETARNWSAASFEIVQLALLSWHATLQGQCLPAAAVAVIQLHLRYYGRGCTSKSGVHRIVRP